jgi:hypothetical protein
MICPWTGSISAAVARPIGPSLFRHRGTPQLPGKPGQVARGRAANGKTGVAL